MHGEGEFTWPDGKSYKGLNIQKLIDLGSYVEDKKDGDGIFQWGDGRQYKGQWKNGKQHGKGILVDKEGKE